MTASGEYGRREFGQGGLNDRLNVEELVGEIGLDDDEIEWRKEFLGFDEEDVRRLERYEEAFAANADRVAEDFYENLTGHQQTVDVIGRSEKGIEQLKRTQSAYLVTLANGEYGADYFADRARIGKIHDLLEMPMKHYLGQYGVYYDLILPIVGDRLVDSLTERLTGAATDGGLAVAEEGPSDSTATPAGDARDDRGGPGEGDVEEIVRAEVDDAIEDVLSILRIVNLDMQVVTDTYIHSYSREIEAEARRNERLMTEVHEELRDPIEDLQTSATDVADSAGTIRDASGEQSDRIREIAAEVGNLSATVEEVASTADQVERASDRAETLAENGRDAADDAAEVMDDIGEAVDGAADDVTALQERVGEIDEFVDAINGIAEQTNLLALNASIEAARAGDAGSGFGVVADEIKSLAEESKRHAGDIEEMVAGIRSDTEETVESLTAANERVSRGVDRVEDAMADLTDIAEAVSETAAGIREVSDVTDDQAAAAEEIAATVDEVVERSARVTDEIGELAAANERQARMVEEVETAVTRLSTERPAAAADRTDPA
ncbi:globin-coupled sensor protein [Halorubrum cibi]|uniref:Methyl-accepting chemotaxis protein n=1 Tax=Halorubrum cibi TaxID=413815 RepID=A0A521AYZ4_9EURY|nr:globin-coupled sensor protein [Halorubrum cibi]SMO40072.1 Methyl-accepting chemotaxis protein [Halorubrum cibi]